MTQPIYLAEVCSVCSEGGLRVRICGVCETAFVLCDECEALWTSPDGSDLPSFPEQPHAPCPQCAASLLQPPSRWADREEINKLGWSSYLAPSEPR